MLSWRSVFLFWLILAAPNPLSAAELLAAKPEGKKNVLPQSEKKERKEGSPNTFKWFFAV